MKQTQTDKGNGESEQVEKIYKLELGGMQKWVILGKLGGLTTKGKVETRLMREIFERIEGDWDSDLMQATSGGPSSDQYRSTFSVNLSKIQVESLRDKLREMLDKGMPLTQSRRVEPALDLLESTIK